MKPGERLEFLLRDTNGRFYPAWIRCDNAPYYTLTLPSTIITVDGQVFTAVNNTPSPNPPLNSYQFSDARDDIRTILFIGGGIQAASLEEAIHKKLNPVTTSISYSASSSAGALMVEDLGPVLSAVSFDERHLRIR